MQYMGVTFSFMFDVFMFHQTFTGLEVLGVCICLVFSLITAIYKHMLSKQQAVQQTSQEEKLLTADSARKTTVEEEAAAVDDSDFKRMK